MCYHYTNAANFVGTQLAGHRCGWLLTYTAALSRDSRHHAASTSTGFASDFRRTRRHPSQPRNFASLRRCIGRIRFFYSTRRQANNIKHNYLVPPLMHSAQERPLSQAYAPCGCEARDHAYGADGRIRTCASLPGQRALCPLSYVCVVPLRELPARHRVRSSVLTGAAPAYGAELI